jgi:hypothetical protein
MDSWEYQTLVVLWTKIFVEISSVCSGGRKVESLAGAGPLEFENYVYGLMSQGWEKFDWDLGAGGMAEALTLRRLVQERGDAISAGSLAA